MQDNIPKKPETKQIAIVLAGLTRLEYREVIEVPVGITDAQLAKLIDARYEAVDRGLYTADDDFWERGECFSESVNSETPSLKVDINDADSSFDIVEIEPIATSVGKFRFNIPFGDYDSANTWFVGTGEFNESKNQFSGELMLDFEHHFGPKFKEHAPVDGFEAGSSAALVYGNCYFDHVAGNSVIGVTALAVSQVTQLVDGRAERLSKTIVAADTVTSAIEAKKPIQSIPAGLVDALREASEILSSLDNSSAPENMRWPLADELQGYAAMIDNGDNQIVDVPPRVLVVVRSGVAETLSDDGVDVEIFDQDNYDDAPELSPGVPEHFSDLAEQAGVPVVGAANSVPRPTQK